MSTPEADRLKEIARRMNALRRRHDKVLVQWQLANRERRNILEELERLSEERENLEQGQLVFFETA